MALSRRVRTLAVDPPGRPAIDLRMNESARRRQSQQDEFNDGVRGYRPPTVEVISLDCEISSYAPDEDDSPLF